MPKLRFPEFNEEWQNRRIGDILTIKSGRNQQNIEDSNGKYPIYGTGGIIGFGNDFLTDKNCVCIGRKGTIDKPIFMNTPFWCVDTLFYSECHDNNYAKFQYNLFETINWYKYNEASGVPSLSRSTIENIKVEVPLYKEQVKISQFISIIENRIKLTEDKIENLKLFKKGFVRKIFKDNINNSKFLKLEDIASISTGKLDANSMVDGGKYRFYTCAREYYKINDFCFDGKALLISGNGANVGYIHYYEGKFNAYQRTYVLQDFTQNIKYVKCFLDLMLSKRIDSEKKEGNTPYIVKSTLADFKIQIPNLCVQIKIAEEIELVDDKIKLLEDTSVALKEFTIRQYKTNKRS